MIAKNLNNDLKQAMKDHDKVALDTIRMIKAALMNKKIKVGHELDDQEELQVLATELKQRKDSLAEFEKAGREDLIKQVKEEIKIVEKYLPQQLDEAAVSKLVEETISEVGAESNADFGKVMKSLMPKVKGQADGSLVNKIVKEKLS